MVGVKYFGVYNDNIYEFPLSKMKDGKLLVSELSSQTVLRVELVYENQNRKPYDIINILFERITFDERGIYDIVAATLTDDFRVDLQYAFRNHYDTIKTITGVDSSPLPIPKAPVIPNNDEIDKLKSYLNQKYPLLLKNSPDAIEHSIYLAQERHKEKIKQMKKSYMK